MPTNTASALTLACLLLCLHAHAQRIQIEGESYARVGGPSKVRILDRKGTYGGKVVSYWEEPGVWLEWDFDVPRADSYCISIRYACRWPDTTRRIEIDGKLPHKACAAVRFAGTGDWAAWRFHTLCDGDGVPIQFQLAEGKHLIRMTNVESRGLAVDTIVLHNPQWPLDDVVVGDTSPWHNVFNSLTYQRTRHQTLIARGSVRVTLDAKGAGELARAASTLFSLGLRGLEPTTKQAFPPISVSVVGSGSTERLSACLLRINRRWQALITDGTALYVVVGPSDWEVRWIPLMPLVYRRGRHLRHAVTWRSAAGIFCSSSSPNSPKPSRRWCVGKAMIISSAPVIPNRDCGRIDFAEPARVAAVKICPPEWSEKGLEVKVESKGSRDIVHSAARDFPALAAFYGYGRFTVEFEWGADLKRCVLNDLASGESVVLWPPKGRPKP